MDGGEHESGVVRAQAVNLLKNLDHLFAARIAAKNPVAALWFIALFCALSLTGAADLRATSMVTASYSAAGSTQSRGRGPLLTEPQAMTSDENGKIFLADSQVKAILTIDLASGDRAVLARLESPASRISYRNGHGEIIASLRDGELVAIDAKSGSVRVLDYKRTVAPKAGVQLSFIRLLTVSLDGKKAYIVATKRVPVPTGLTEFLTIFEVDLTTMVAREIQSAPGKPRFSLTEASLAVYAAAPLADGAILVYYKDIKRNSIEHFVEIDPATGTKREMVLQFPLLAVTSILRTDQGVLIVDHKLRSIILLRDKGAGQILSGRENFVKTVLVGAGPELAGPTELAVAGDGRILILDNLQKAILAMDPRSGNRILVSGHLADIEKSSNRLSASDIRKYCDLLLGFDDLQQMLIAEGRELAEIYFDIRCPVYGVSPEGVEQYDKVLGTIDLAKHKMVTSHSFVIGLSRYYIRERNDPEALRIILNRVESVPRFGSGTAIDWLRFHGANPKFSDDFRQSYKSRETIIRRFGALTAAELSAR